MVMRSKIAFYIGLKPRGRKLTVHCYDTRFRSACEETMFPISWHCLDMRSRIAFCVNHDHVIMIKHLITKKQSSHLMKTYSLIGRSCFSTTMKFINEAKLNVLDKTPIFQIPISEDQARQILIFDQYLGKRFKKTDALRKAVITYPQDDLLFAKVQIALGKRFKPTIVSHW